jgi:NADPH oxidase
VHGERRAYLKFLLILAVRFSFNAKDEILESFVSGAMELRIIKPSFKYTAGQWLFIQIPELSHFQWHPVRTDLLLTFVEMAFDKMPQFTITSAPEDPYVSIHIRQVGDFTRGLGDRLGVGPSVVASMTQAAMKGAEKDEKSGMSRGDYVELDPAGSSITLPAIRIDGPYGAPAEDVFGAEVAILIGAGIGECLKRVQ